MTAIWDMPQSELDRLLPPPDPDRPYNWRDDAACRGTDPKAFFPEGTECSGAIARRICGTCPVRDECLEWALAHHVSSYPREVAGIWGATSWAERERIMRRRRREAKAG